MTHQHIPFASITYSGHWACRDCDSVWEMLPETDMKRPAWMQKAVDLLPPPLNYELAEYIRKVEAKLCRPKPRPLRKPLGKETRMSRDEFISAIIRETGGTYDGSISDSRVRDIDATLNQSELMVQKMSPDGYKGHGFRDGYLTALAHVQHNLFYLKSEPNKEPK